LGKFRHIARIFDDGRRRIYDWFWHSMGGRMHKWPRNYGTFQPAMAIARGHHVLYDWWFFDDLVDFAVDSRALNFKKMFLKNIKYAFVGLLFGIVFVKAEIISWFRIQEMFRFESFHMYGVIGTAVAVGALSVFLLKKMGIKTISGEEISIEPKVFHKGHIYGGLLFGFGWAMTGACPGPLFAQIGTGASVILVTLFSAIAGTWVYGRFREKLPH
jgi:uncharacterized protein